MTANYERRVGHWERRQRHYSVLAQLDAQAAWRCYTVPNFTDANNWTFSVTRDTLLNSQNC